ncbi:alpha/beta fold hydrolase [Thalassospira xiamenensis]|uniref:Lysophospholipase n=1 Tax=Thalassospira xiamenensis TaxID=220697 RepID=A0A367XE01_9PROT|nr:alpha/beta hydrolase [Thalassospira xiamenensis]KZB54580.1 lysophospholipase [Thalassospira xiamenensis]RCK50862.1 lysophospholipase [Thalassospira xiamenensis]
MTFAIDRFTGQSGLTLRYALYSPENALGHVLILQGRGEFIERYDETARELAERGLGCVTFDFRGQGGSTREVTESHMGYVGDVGHYVEDTHDVLRHLANQHNTRCDLLLTHSTGGLVGMHMLLENPDLFGSAVMIAPFFGLGGPDWIALAAQFLSAGLCRYGFNKQFLPGQKLLSPLQPFADDNLLTSDRARYERNVTCLQDNPDLVVGGVSAGWLDACFRAQAELSRRVVPDNDFAAAPLPPITMVLSGNDQVVSNRATQELFGDHPSVTMVEIPESRHEILQESDHFRALFWQAFDQHLANHHHNWTLPGF